MLLVWIVGNDEFSLNRFCHFPSQFLIDLPSISMEVKFVIIIRPHAGIIMKGDVVKSDFDKKESRLWSFNRAKSIGASIGIWSSTLALLLGFFCVISCKKKDYGRQKQILTPKNFTGNTKRLNILTMEIDFERNFRSIYFMPALVTLTQTWSFILQSNSFSLLTATDLIWYYRKCLYALFF